MVPTVSEHCDIFLFNMGIEHSGEEIVGRP